MGTPHDLPQDLDAPAEQGDRVLHLSDRQLDLYPDVMRPADMCRAFDIKHSTFYVRLKAGFFDRFEIKPRMGRPVWSGPKVKEHIQTAGRSAFVFGRKRAS